jgi:hypothetical protein
MNRRTRTRFVAALVATCALTVGAVAVATVSESDSPGPRLVPATPVRLDESIDPRSLELPASEARPSWVSADGTVDESSASSPLRRDAWLRDDGSIDCALVPKTIRVVTADGKLLLDARGRIVRVPNLALPGDCGPFNSPAVVAAWNARIDALAEAAVRARGGSVPAPPVVHQSVPATE